MKPISLACAMLLASFSTADADEAESQHLESQNDIAFTVPFSPRFGHRVLARLTLNDRDQANVYEIHYGISWRFRERTYLDLTVGESYADDGPDAGHALVVGVRKDMAFDRGRLMFHLENLHRYDGAYRYDGFYSVDYAVVGVHVLNVGREAAAGFQLGSGQGLLPFRFDIRISFGLTDGMPDRSSRFVMTFDFR